MDRKISVDQLRPGMYVHRLGGSWTHRLLWKSELLLKDQAEIRQIHESGTTEVWIDTSRGLDIIVPPAHVEKPPEPPAAESAPEPEKRPQSQSKTCSLADELDRAATICSKAKKVVSAMFHEARMGKALDGNGAMQLVEEISSSVERNPAALISLARLKTKDDYTYLHSVAVCGMMVGLARQLDLGEEATRDAGLAGLIHDIGKMAIPLEVLNKPGKLTDQEYTLIKTHPEAGHKLLLEGEGVREAALDVCLHHHERVDGRGYPHRLKGDQISLFAKMGAVCDVYDAITSNRPYKAGWNPAESLQKMAGWAGGDYESSVFQAFVKSVGIYPTGSLVKMVSGRLGVVMEQGGKTLLQPRIKVFFSTRSNARIPPEIVDLSRPGCQDRIVGPELAANWGLKNIETLWAGDAAPHTGG